MWSQVRIQGPQLCKIEGARVAIELEQTDVGSSVQSRTMSESALCCEMEQLTSLKQELCGYPAIMRQD